VHSRNYGLRKLRRLGTVSFFISVSDGIGTGIVINASWFAAAIILRASSGTCQST